MDRAERSFQQEDYASAVLYLKMAYACDPNRQDVINLFYSKLYKSLKNLQKEKAAGSKPKILRIPHTIYVKDTILVTDNSALDSLLRIIGPLQDTLKILKEVEKINACNYNNALALSKLSSDLPLALKILHYNRYKYSSEDCCPDSLCLKIDPSYVVLHENKFVLRSVFPHDIFYDFPDDTTKAILDGDFNPGLKMVVTIGTNDSIKLWNLDGDRLDSTQIWPSTVTIGQTDSFFVTHHRTHSAQLWTLNDSKLNRDKTVGDGREISDFLLSEINGEAYILYLSKKRVFGEKIPSGNIFYRSRINTYPPTDSLGLGKRKLSKFGWCRHSVKIWPPPSKKKRFWQLRSIRTFNISPKGDYFITGDKGGRLRYRSTSGNFSRKLKRMNGVITTIDISENGRYFIAGSANGEMGIWDKEGSLLHFFYEQAIEKISTIKFAPGFAVLNGMENEESIFYDLATAGLKNGKGMVLVWKEKEGHLNLSQILPLGDGKITSMKISPDGHHILATTTNGKAYLWQSGKKLKEDIETLTPNTLSLLRELKEAGVRLFEEDYRILDKFKGKDGEE